MDERREITALLILVLALSWGVYFFWIDHENCVERIEKRLDKLEQKQESPKPDYSKYRDCCTYYPD